METIPSAEAARSRCSSRSKVTIASSTSREALLDPIPEDRPTYLGFIAPLVVWGSFELLALGGPSEACSTLAVTVGS